MKKAVYANKQGNIQPLLLRNPRKKFWHSITRNWELYLLFLPVLVYYIIFSYVPLYGIQLAFKRFSPSLGIFGSRWVGFDNFTRFFNGAMFSRTLTNTLGISFYTLAAGFWPPIILALMLNEVKIKFFKKTVQTITYMPHFISTVVMAGMIIIYLSPSSGGFVPKIMEFFGKEPVNLLYDAKYFKHIYVLSGIWQGIGWGSILYLAALAGIDEEIYEAAIIDGASRMQRIWHINIPGIMPTVCILLILNCGGIMNVGFEKVFLLMNDLNTSGAEVISTYTYKMGLINRDFGFSTAVGLFNSVINCTLLITVNTIVRKLGQASLI